MQRGLWIILLVMLPVLLPAQDWKGTIFMDGQEAGSFSLPDSTDISAYINTQLTGLWSLGYLFSGLDSLSGHRVYLHRGLSYPMEVGEVWIYNAFSDTYDKSRDRFKGVEHVLADFANNGYPFARVQNDSLQAYRHGYRTFLSVRPGDKIVYDTLVIIGKVKVGRNFLAKAMGMEVGDAYSEKTFERIAQRMKRLTYLNLKADPDVAFERGKAIVFLKMEDQEANRFEGVLGLQSSSTSKTTVTGYLNLTLANLFRSGKSFDFVWNKYADQSQSLNMAYNHPFLLNTPLFAQVDFGLLRQDTTFLTQDWNFSLGTGVGSRSEVYFGYEVTNGSLISAEELDIADGVADYKSDVYSIGLRDPTYSGDFRFENGFRYQTSMGVGQKQILKNSAVDDSAYDTLDMRTQILKFTGGVKYLIKLGNGTALYYQIQGHLYFNDEVLTNELERLGGLRTIRGFSEKYFYAQNYAYSRLELRQYFESASYFMIFYDQGVLYNKVTTYPRGFGLGLSLNTSNGLFNFAMALGSTADVPVDPSNIKIHLGYISSF